MRRGKKELGVKKGKMARERGRGNSETDTKTTMGYPRTKVDQEPKKTEDGETQDKKFGTVHRKCDGLLRMARRGQRDVGKGVQTQGDWSQGP